MAPYTLRWGILACGGIAQTFTKDLLLDPATRDVHDVRHEVVAVASSTSADRAREFVKEVGAKESTKAYGSYEELVQDENVDIIYIATPHSHHYQNALLSLRGGKHVCCEKAFTINAKQAKHVVQLAQEKKIYLFEAVWTRFFPLMIALQKLLHEDRILGKTHRVHADLGMPFKRDVKHRLFNPDLGGGALLDLGVYPFTHVFLYLFQDPDNERTPPVVTSSILKTPETGVDEFTTVSLNFPKLHANGLVTANMTVKSPEDRVVLIQGEKGSVSIPWPPYRPESFIVKLHDQEPQMHNYPIHGQGMHWEADACARDIRDGKLESDRFPLSESIVIMEAFDEVRKQADFQYPEALEWVEA